MKGERAAVGKRGRERRRGKQGLQVDSLPAAFAHHRRLAQRLARDDEREARERQPAGEARLECGRQLAAEPMLREAARHRDCVRPAEQQRCGMPPGGTEGGVGTERNGVRRLVVMMQTARQVERQRGERQTHAARAHCAQRGRGGSHRAERLPRSNAAASANSLAWKKASAAPNVGSCHHDGGASAAAAAILCPRAAPVEVAAGGAVRLPRDEERCRECVSKLSRTCACVILLVHCLDQLSCYGAAI